MTSYNWLVERRKKGMWYRLMNIFGSKWSKAMFILLQLCYTILVMLPCYLFYYRLVLLLKILAISLMFLLCSLEANIFAIMIFMCFACWNGAQYYIDIFSESYHLQFEKLQWTKLCIELYSFMHVKYLAIINSLCILH